MERLSLWVLLGLTMFALSMHDVQVSADVGPSESECRPYIEKAIHELKTGDTTDDEPDNDSNENQESSVEDTGPDIDSKENKTDEDNEDDEKSAEQKTDDDLDERDAVVETIEESVEESVETTPETNGTDESDETAKDNSEEKANDSNEEATQSQEDGDDDDQKSTENEDSKDDEDDEEKSAEKDDGDDDDQKSGEEKDDVAASEENDDGAKSSEDVNDHDDDDGDKSQEENADDDDTDSGEAADKKHDEEESGEEKTDDDDGQSDENQDGATESKENDGDDDDDDQEKVNDNTEEEDDDDQEEVKSRGKRSAVEDDDDDDDDKDAKESKEEDAADDEESQEDSKDDKDDDKAVDDDEDSKEGTTKEEDDDDDSKDTDDDKKKNEEEGSEEGGDDDDDDEKSEEESRPEDDLLLEVDIPDNLRDRKHIDELLHLEEEFEERENAIDRVAEIILRDLKRIYDNAIKPLETMYKYRDLSNRHYGDPEIFSKPLILFMGPWSGGKSSIINYLTDNEYTPDSLRTGAEPSPAYFNILMHGNETEVLDGTQLAADWTFSGLQKFGQGLEERLRGLKLPNKLLEKVNIVEIPGILEVRKQVSRLFPFNDACQWFIDRADIIFLVYDPAKLDVGPETEAILDQLKGREYQTRIILNKADTVKPEELLRVQSALIWNISPLMSSAQPPVMYTTSLWSHPYETSSPVRLLQAQERAFLRDIRGAIDKRIENKISSARRFAVRVRNHAKMVDCYLTTYYNHKTLFGNKKRISDQIIENPQNYHIYEGLSTLTNISRYDLPDPEVYRDFFHLNPLFEFKKLAETCTYFRGCPINKLDVAIAYDFPELVGKYKKMAESAISAIESIEKTEKSRS